VRGADAVDRHLADSLTGLEVDALAGADRIADLGAGAGFPGLALAVALPDARVDLIEATARKCEVIERLARAADAPNARTVPHRAEEWAAGEGAAAYAAVTARALAPLSVIAEYAAPLLREGGVLVAWKGSRDEDEERRGAAAAEQLGLGPPEVMRVEPFEGAANRHLHVFPKTGPTPEGFPRRPGMARKRPLR
jgi:16S rRNA (guanine527-N7)-methyltransferase